jgi:hypothetical protein
MGRFIPFLKMYTCTCIYIFCYIFYFFVFQYELCKPPKVGREVDEDFLQQLDEVAGCELPQALKFQISELVEKHCQMSGLSINLDVSSLGSLSDDLKKLFVKMMNYATNMNSNTKKLVIDLVKAISETPRSDPSSPVDTNVGGGPPFDPPPPPRRMTSQVCF